MILTGSSIKKFVAQGRIVIEPFSDELINPNSYNYRLGNTIVEFESDILEPSEKPKTKTIVLSDDGYILKPGKLYLASTYEKIGSDSFVTSLIGRSSVGRLGIFVQITADLGNLGAKHHWTLELSVVQPIRIYPRMRIGQVSFWTTQGTISSLYNGKYAQHAMPHHSKIYQEIKPIQDTTEG